MPLPPTFDARMVAARVLSPSVRELTFERSDGAPFAFEPGQWVSFILWSDGNEIRRSYSIASAPEGTGRFDVTVTRVTNGPGSSVLHAMQPGTLVRVVGPQGFFTRPLGANASPSLFVATGTGVTPFRSMLRAANLAGDRTPTWLLFGVRREDDILYRDELTTLAAAHPHFRFVPTLSQPGEAWEGRHGYVQTHVRALLEELAALPASDGRSPHAYVCGLQRMVGSVRDLLRKEMALPRERVHSERYD